MTTCEQCYHLCEGLGPICYECQHDNEQWVYGHDLELKMPNNNDDPITETGHDESW